MSTFYCRIFALQIAFFGLNEKFSPEDIFYSSDLYNEFGGNRYPAFRYISFYWIKKLLSA